MLVHCPRWRTKRMEKGCARRLLSDLSRRGCSRFSLAMCLRSLAMSFRWTIAVAIRTSAFVVLCRFHSLLILKMKVKRVSSAAVQRYGTSTRSQSDIHRSFRSLSVCCAFLQDLSLGFRSSSFAGTRHTAQFMSLS